MAAVILCGVKAVVITLVTFRTAAAYVASPAWVAVITHVPPPGFTVRVVPLISQIVDAELVVKVTALPDELVALKA